MSLFGERGRVEDVVFNVFMLSLTGFTGSVWVLPSGAAPSVHRTHRNILGFIAFVLNFLSCCFRLDPGNVLNVKERTRTLCC